MSNREKIIEKLKLSTDSESIIDYFGLLYDRYVSGETGLMAWSDVQVIPKSRFQSVETWDTSDRSLLSKLAFLKLNGGLGTSMGCSGAKCLIPMSEGRTFLEVFLLQMMHQRHEYNVDIPIIFMNSFKTEHSTKEAIPSDILSVFHFNQSKFPRIRARDNLPFECPEALDQEWAPSGHGDLYRALSESGLLDELILNGIEYVFVSNIDNLGPQLDLRILTRMVQHNLSFVMEVTPRTLSDVKGGLPVTYRDRLTLLERAQVPDKYLSQFEDVSVFPTFNTNNLWLHLPSVRTLLSQRSLDLPLIINRKHLYGTDIVQFETAMGAALSCFERSEIVVVGRNRFLPVKTMNDLVVLQSDMVKKDWKTGSLSFS